ncbi:hypothetical protein KI655_06645 [Vibrio sp. D404a]|uniref:hypothetical protein n=1 Tax=unclassified Vibrio TaxID=2614977 RepID=UPI002556C3C3|nr:MULTISPECIES: hypothetical protein [unclassified Vibrio]MDK9736977.1 hypothetical protein [Vibrio sp. D404a]MDK9798124.1 hypothetical protein [Vibrio sp. D449a]
MKTMIFLFLVLFLSPYALSHVHNKAYDNGDELNERCESGSEYHENRIFDGISSSEYINWTQVELMNVSSRYDYSNTMINHVNDEYISCDLIIDYEYNDKKISINSTYLVSLENDEIKSTENSTKEAVKDFIVRVIVN